MNNLEDLNWDTLNKLQNELPRTSPMYHEVLAVRCARQRIQHEEINNLASAQFSTKGIRKVDTNTLQERWESIGGE